VRGPAGSISQTVCADTHFHPAQDRATAFDSHTLFCPLSKVHATGFWAVGRLMLYRRVHLANWRCKAASTSNCTMTRFSTGGLSQVHFFSCISREKQNKPFSFIDIVESPKADIFSTFVFNNIAKLSCIFRPPVFPRRTHHGAINHFPSATYNFWPVPRISSKSLCFHTHRGKHRYFQGANGPLQARQRLCFRRGGA